MSKTEKVNKIKKEIESIEWAIRPYEYYTYDVTFALKVLAEIKEILSDPEKADLSQVMEKLKILDELAERYRGYPEASEALYHLNNIKKIL